MTHYVWQPIILIVNERIECECGNKAVFIVLDDMKKNPDGDFSDWDYAPWCQECWEREQGEVEA